MISVCGGGAWGSALAFALAHKQPVSITSRRVLESNLNTPFKIEQVCLEQALRARYIVVAISTPHLRRWLADSIESKNAKYLFAAKGIEEGTGAFVHEIANEFISSKHIACLSGPSFASEVCKCLPCAISIHSSNLALAEEFADFFPLFMKSYVGTDLVGAEIAGAYKNVIAIAGGICDGLCLGNNAKAALLARGLVEMERFGRYFGGKIETFLGLEGAGDLFLTANSTLSRNYRVGIALAKGQSLQSALAEIGEVAEGVLTARAIASIAYKREIYTPIVNEVVAIFDGKSCKEGILSLMSR